LKKLAPEGVKGFEKPHSRVGQGFEKAVRKGFVGIEEPTGATTHQLGYGTISLLAMSHSY